MNEENKVKEEVKEEKHPKAKKDKKECKCSKEVERLANENLLLNEKVLRLSAEIQNINRRNQEEKMNIYKYEGENLIKEILPILDNFERAINVDSTKLSEELAKYLTGFKMIYTGLLTILNNIGVKEIEALDKEFDPNTMNAIMTDKIKDKDKNIVLEVMQKGYTYNDKVIRPAMVKVNE